MARNRKYQSAAVRFAPAIKVLLVCSFMVASGVGYVWQKGQLVDLGRRKSVLEKRLYALQGQSKKLEGELISLQLPKSLNAKVIEFKLGLQPAQANQIVHLPEPPSALAAGSAEETPVRSFRREPGSNRDALVNR
jgi:hypothetical protein